MLETAILGIAGALIALVAFATIIGLIFYILGAIGLMKIANREGLKHAWFAWIPLLNQYLVGELGFENRSSYGWLFLGMTLFSFISGMLVGDVTTDLQVFFGILSSIVAVVYVVLFFVASYRIFVKYSDKAVLMTVFNVLSLTALAPIFFFAIRNNKTQKKA